MQGRDAPTRTFERSRVLPQVEQSSESTSLVPTSTPPHALNAGSAEPCRLHSLPASSCGISDEVCATPGERWMNGQLPSFRRRIPPAHFYKSSLHTEKPTAPQNGETKPNETRSRECGCREVQLCFDSCNAQRYERDGTDERRRERGRGERRAKGGAKPYAEGKRNDWSMDDLTSCSWPCG